MKKIAKTNKLNIKQAEKLLYETIFDNDEMRREAFLEATNAMTTNEIGELETAAIILHESREFVNLCLKDKNFFYCVEPIRKGFIGKEVFDQNGTKYIQANRGPIIGYFAAIKGEEKGEHIIHYGFSFISKHEKYPHKLIGQALAIKNAIKAKDKNVRVLEEYENRKIPPGVESQLEHFIKRSKAYFYPETFSFSRGKNSKMKALLDTDYDRIHLCQYAFDAANADTTVKLEEALKQFKRVVDSKKKKLKIKDR